MGKRAGKKRKERNVRKGCFYGCLVFFILLGAVVSGGYLYARHYVRRGMPDWEIAEMNRFFEEPVELPEEWRKVEPFPEDLTAAGRDLCEKLRAVDVEAWSDKWRPVLNRLQSGSGISEAEWAGLRKALEEFPDVLESAARFVEMPGYELEAFPSRESDADYIDGSSVYLASEILCLNSYLLAHDGNWPEAFHPCLICLQMTRRPLASRFYTHVVAGSREKKAAICISNLAGECDDAGALRSLLVEMNRLDRKINLDAFTDPLLIDSVGQLRWYVRQGRLAALESGLTRAELVRRAYRPQTRRPEPIKVEYVFDEWGRLIVANSLFVRDAPFSRPAEELFYRKLIPNYRAERVREQATEVAFDLARLAVASRLYELENGGPPGSTADLVPAYFDEELVDPFSGKPYQSGKERGVFYSPGPDEADGSARVVYDPTNGTMSAGDIFETGGIRPEGSATVQ